VAYTTSSTYRGVGMNLSSWPGWPPPATSGQIVIAITLIVIYLALLFFRGPMWYRLNVKWNRRTKTYEKGN